MDENVLIEKYKFIRDDVFLCPLVDIRTGRQRLIIQKINSKTGRVLDESSMRCIHTAVMDLNYDQFMNLQNNNKMLKKLYRKTLHIRSSEKLTEIRLTPEEKFKAFKSWAAGIAEIGIGAFKIQEEIDSCANRYYPIATFLLRFLARTEPDFIYDYLTQIERECMFEGVRHDTSLIANLALVLKTIFWKTSRLSKKRKVILNAVIEMDPPFKLYTYDYRLLKKILKNIPDLFSKVDNFLDFFSDPDENTRRAMASSLAATKFDQFKNLFTDESWKVRKEVALNPKSIEFDEFTMLFKDKRREVRATVASRSKSVEFKEYVNFFTDKSFFVRRAAQCNPKAKKCEGYNESYHNRYYRFNL